MKTAVMVTIYWVHYLIPAEINLQFTVILSRVGVSTGNSPVTADEDVTRQSEVGEVEGSIVAPN